MHSKNCYRLIYNNYSMFKVLRRWYFTKLYFMRPYYLHYIHINVFFKQYIHLWYMHRRRFKDMAAIKSSISPVVVYDKFIWLSFPFHINQLLNISSHDHHILCSLFICDETSFLINITFIQYMVTICVIKIAF